MKNRTVSTLTNHFFSDFSAYDEDTNDTEETYTGRGRFNPICPSFVTHSVTHNKKWATA